MFFEVVLVSRELNLGECVTGFIGWYRERLYSMFVKCKKCSQQSNKKVEKSPPDLAASHC